MGRLIAAGLLFAGCVSSAVAADHFLTIGGGYSPTGNQISLEKNVHYFRRLLDEKYTDGCQHDLYFSDGNNPGRDLQYQLDPETLSRAHVLLSRVFRQTRYFGNRYRSHDLTEVRGSSSRKNLEKWFDDVGAKMVSGDRLVIYVTAHGGKSTDKKRPANSALYLWNRERILASELADQLKKLPSGVSVVTVMVQCYSGGFSNLLFENANDQIGKLVDRDVCGFYATVHDRVAAGCTPDIDEENYREYSSYFWAAMLGKTRTGGDVPSTDYDGDGRVSLAEAHAYSLLTSETIDISVKTSDTFLRKFSRLGPPKPPAGKQSNAKDKEQANGRDATGDKSSAGAAQANGQAPAAATMDATRPEPPPLPEPSSGQTERWLTVKTPYSRLLETLTPVDRQVVEGLSNALELTSEDRIAEIDRLAESIQKERKAIDGKIGTRNRELSQTATAISNSLKVRWPELSNRWDPMVDQLFTDEAEALVQAVEQHGSYKKFEEARVDLQGLSNQKLDLERRWVKCQRLKRSLENAILAANLPLAASPEISQRYARLLQAENQFLGGSASGLSPKVTAAGVASPEGE